ncbi:MAG: B3/B4 domain-containing protein [Geodermatophilaceae bacterium]
MFGYADAVIDRFPTIRAGVIHATNLVNGPSSPALLEAYRAEQRNVSERLSASAIAELPSVSTLVDIGNLVSIRYAMPVAVFDLADIAGSITVRFAAGAELFTDLGAADSVHPEPGEATFVDNNDVVSARRWCWRQSARSATRPSTVDALFVIEGHHDSAEQEIALALGASLCRCPSEPANPDSAGLDGVVVLVEPARRGPGQSGQGVDHRPVLPYRMPGRQGGPRLVGGQQPVGQRQ